MNGSRAVRSAAPLAALGAGLLAFFAIESAIARRVGLDLFLPVYQGTFLPGRMARLAACLVLCLALFLTERGRALGRTLDAACQKDRFRWALGAAVTGLFFAWALRVTALAYMTIDDVSFLRAAARVPEQGLAALQNTLSHSAQENTSSTSVLLCWLIGQFYGLAPEGDWYLYYHLAVLLGSLTVIGRCVLVKTSRAGWPVWAGCAIHGLLCGGVFLYTFARIAFTVTPAVAGSAAAALMLCRHHASRRAGRVMSDVLSGALMVLCFAQRRATGYCLLCFWALAVAYQVLRIRLSGRQALARPLVSLCLCAVMTLAFIGGLWAADRLECDDAYRQSEYYRSLVGDYLNDRITYDQYAQVGVPQELAALIYGWYFMDERVTTEMFRDVSEIYYGELTTPSLPAQAADAAGYLARSVTADRQMLAYAGCAAALLLGCLAALLRFGRRYWPELLCALCAAGGGTVLLLDLARDGRFLIRVFLVVALPAIVMLLLLALSAPEDEPDGPPARRIAVRILAGVCAGGMSVCCAVGMYTTPHAAQSLSRADVFARQNAIESYANANPDTTIVTCVYDDYDACTDPLHSAYTYPQNLVEWGYCGDLAKDPADRLYADAFFRPDVQFMTDNLSAVPLLLQYLSLDWGPVQATAVARPASGITVCTLEQVVPPSPDYTGWYEQNGMTYYFRDGQALTGQQTIDGQSYTFAPAGAQAQFTALSGSTLVYTTDAYSLIVPEDAP